MTCDDPHHLAEEPAASRFVHRDQSSVSKWEKSTPTWWETSFWIKTKSIFALFGVYGAQIRVARSTFPDWWLQLALSSIVESSAGSSASQVKADKNGNHVCTLLEMSQPYLGCCVNPLAQSTLPKLTEGPPSWCTVLARAAVNRESVTCLMYQTAAIVGDILLKPDGFRCSYRYK